MKKTVLVLALAALILTTLSMFAMAAAGCGVDNCHEVGSKYDLTAEAKAVDGHPPVKAGALYEDCVKCHKSGPLAFGPILHKGHYHEGENHFTSNPDRNCQSCHQLDLKTGKFTVVYAK